MNRFLAKLLPRYFRRIVRIEISADDWLELCDKIKDAPREFRDGDEIKLLAEKSRTLITFLITRGNRSVETPNHP
jgi:hypothetical protein